MSKIYSPSGPEAVAYRGMVIFVTWRFTLAPPTIFVEILYETLKILDKFNFFVNKLFEMQFRKDWEEVMAKEFSKKNF